MFEAAVDGFGGTVAGVGVVEVGQDVPGSAFECPAQRHELGQAPRYARGGQARRVRHDVCDGGSSVRAWRSVC